jgi:ATP-dependent helicase/nuclease subunit B
MLIKAPYNFFAKQILKLKPTKKLEDKPNLAEFGIFFHNIMEKFTQNYQQGQDHENIIKNIIDKLLAEIALPKIRKKLWQTKLLAMIPDLVLFEQERQKNIAKIFTEQRGQINLALEKRHIIIAAIADRIEITKKGEIYIMDYKTGIIPTKKDIITGKAPQMLIEAMILLEGGFDIAASYKIDFSKINITYLKINSNPPYLTETNFVFTKNEINTYGASLKKLLDYYLAHGYYETDIFLSSYDDYAHLARRS